MYCNTDRCAEDTVSFMYKLLTRCKRQGTGKQQGKDRRDKVKGWSTQMEEHKRGQEDQRWNGDENGMRGRGGAKKYNQHGGRANR